MTLEELIAQLSLYDPNKIVAKGFSSPHSYRGYYDELAFEPTDNVTVGSMLADAESALGETFEGYKGGEYKMGAGTTVNLAAWSCCGEPISSGMLSWMIEGSDSAAEIASLRAQVAALVALVEELAVDPGRSDQWPGTYENWRYFDNQRKLAVRRMREILG